VDLLATSTSAAPSYGGGNVAARRETRMGTEENKAVVRRFMHEFVLEGKFDVADEVLAPDYVNLALGGGGAEAGKAMHTAMIEAEVGQRYEDEELVAEGDVVTARFRYILTFPDASTAEVRALAYYRLVDGRIAVNDVMFDPNLMQILGPHLGPPPEA
jgi:predicted SnoaL-like aldol condensation-catalyzing enzyme